MSTTLDKRTYHQTIDFDSLMREARKHITALAGQVWSDHNSSDPGITQLEVLAFCIADLSYRTSFDVKHIIEGYKGDLTTPHDLPLADVVLPNNPVTIKDLRKVLIDMDHPAFLKHELENNVNLKPEFNSYPTKLLVRNAFPIIVEGTEVDFFAVSKDKQDSFLTYDTSYEYVDRTGLTSEIGVLTPKESSGKQVATVREENGVEKAGSVDQKAEETSTDKMSSKETLMNLNQRKMIPVDYQKNSDLDAASSISNALNQSQGQYNEHIIGSTKLKKDYKNIDQIILNGLYALQIEFEEDAYYEETEYLRDLNQNYFNAELNVNGKLYTISVLMPYWDDIKWSLKDIDLTDNDLIIDYAARGLEEYFIAVDKLNYDDYFYDYYAEVKLNDHKLPLFIKLETSISDKITVNGKEYEFVVNFMDWNELSNGVNSDFSGFSPNPSTSGPHDLKQLYTQGEDEQVPSAGRNSVDEVTIKNVGIKGEVHTFDIQSRFGFNKIKKKLKLDGTLEQIIKPKKIKLLTRIEFVAGTVIENEAGIINELRTKFKDLCFERIALEHKLYEALKLKSTAIYPNYLEKLKRVFEYLYAGKNCIWSHLGQYRNICEDYSKFSASRVQEIALFGKVIVAPDFNVNELLAEIYFRVDQFLSPLVKFNALSEMTSKGYQLEDLFNGPLLAHGFIEDDDLDNLKRRSVVYTSDLIRIIMDVPGVLAVEDFNISSYIDNRLMGRNVINCLNLTNSDIYKPRFSFQKTALEVWVDGKANELSTIDLKKWYDDKLRLAKEQQITLQDNSSLQVPQGRDMEIEDYYSIQNDFPEVYGIGEYGLPVDATEERKARAKQLKAFLLPFEQLLANYLKQIAHLPELFSYHRNIKSSYATQPLYNVPDVQPLFSGFIQNGGTWNDFKEDLENSYQQVIEKGETEDQFRSRRNRFLSHLLARFGESFEAYATQMFDQHKALLNDPLNGIDDYLTARGKTLDKLSKDKIAFAEDYSKVSAQRYKSFDMTLPGRDRWVGNWNNQNIESYKLRLCRLLGIEQIENAPIFRAKKDQSGEWIDVEGMHIVEHILLRPRTTKAQLMRLENRPLTDGNGSFIFQADKDPYSFRVTIVLTRYAGRFNDERFRAFTEKLIRMETPAHIRVDFKWMSGECGVNFEKHYSAWKQNSYKVKPYIFQNIDDWSELKMEDLIQDPTKDESGKLVSKQAQKRLDERLALLEVKPNILVLQDNLIDALESVCHLKLNLYNQGHEIFSPVNDQVTFEEKRTDIFNLRVNEIGGEITLYKFNVQTNSWVSQTQFKPIIKTYFNCSDFLPQSNGLTSEFGGRGLYKIEYALEDWETVSLLVEVTKAPVPVHIYLGWRLEDDGQMLSFDTEKDGVFRISNKNWKGYFMEFAPFAIGQFQQANDPYNHPDPIEFGKAYISSPSTGLIRTELGGALEPTKVDPRTSLSAIYDQYGPGIYHIEYELGGQTTFADIELFIELSITVLKNKTVMEPDTDGIIRVPASQRIIDLILDIPDGTLTVYDLDDFSVLNPTQNKLGNFNELDEAYSGAHAFYKSVSHIQIDRDKDTNYLDGHRYQFVYSKAGLETSVTILFEAPELEVPTIKLFRKGKQITDTPILITVDPLDEEYSLEFHPKDAMAEAWIMDGGQKKIIEQFLVPKDHHFEPMKPAEIYGAYGAGPIFISVKNAVGRADLDFSLRLKDVETPLNVKIKNTRSEKEIVPEKGVYTLVYDYQDSEQVFELIFTQGPGKLMLQNEDGKEFTLPVEDERIAFNGIDQLPEGLSTGTYKATYVAKDGRKIEFILEVINLNPTFKLEDIRYKRPSYLAIGTPLFPDARAYIWRIDEKYVSRSKRPELELNFGRGKTLTVTLTMHLDDYEASFEMKLTRDEIKELRDDQ